MSTLIGIGIDYGVTGAVAAIGSRFADGPHRTAILHAGGAGGYYGRGQAGTLDAFKARDVLLEVVRAVTPDGSPSVRVFVVIEQLLSLPGEGRARGTRTATDHATWCAVAKVTGMRLAKMTAASVDKRAGLKRSTVGRANRKAEIADFVASLQMRGVLLPDLGLTPPGGRNPSQGARDAMLCAVAAYRTIGGAL